MVHSFKFTILRLAPEDARNESINIGVAILAERGLDVRLSNRLDKIRTISAAVDVDELRNLTSSLKDLYGSVNPKRDGFSIISRVGPLALSNEGSFVAETHDLYETRVREILRTMVDPEPAPRRLREKRSGLLTQLKKEFRQERVLAKKDETIDSHRIVAGYELDEGLVADLVLKNGAFHVVETVDASNSDEALRKAISDIAVSALVLERARMKFGEKTTKAKLVYSASPHLERIAQPSLDAAQNQGAELINWQSSNDRNKFVHAFASIATPIERKRGRKVRVSSSSSGSLPLN